MSFNMKMRIHPEAKLKKRYQVINFISKTRVSPIRDSLVMLESKKVNC